MKLVKRYDYSGSVTAEAEMTPEGFLKIQARATRTGVLCYRQMDGSIVRELRHPDEVFKPESMASLAMKPMTNDHPNGLLDSETASMHQIGMTGEKITIDDDKYLRIMTVITDKNAIRDYEKGKVEVSPGYVCEMDFTPGTFDGEEYDAVQKNIRYNHLALVKKGRSGPSVRLDADDAIEVEENQEKETKKMKVKLDGKEFEVSDEVGAAIQAQAAIDAKAAGAKLDEATKEKEKLGARIDGLESELSKAKKEHTDSVPSQDDIRKAAKVRVALEKTAEACGVEKFDEMGDLAIKKAVILAQHADAKLDGKSEDYIDARFDVASEAIKASDDSAKKLGEKITKEKRETEVMDSDDARQKMIERNRGLWKSKSE